MYRSMAFWLLVGTKLDVDIAVESIDHPKRFPLVSKVRSDPPSQRTRQKQARR